MQFPEEVRGPVILHMDDRQTVSDLKKMVMEKVGSHLQGMGAPGGVSRLRLSEVRAHCRACLVAGKMGAVMRASDHFLGMPSS